MKINEDYKNAIEYEMKMKWNENEPRDYIYKYKNRIEYI